MAWAGSAAPFEQRPNALELTALMSLRFHGRFASQGFNPADARRHCAFAFDAERTDGSRGRHVNASAQFFGRAKFNHAHRVSILLPKQHHRPGRLRVGNGHVTMFLAGMVGQDAALNQGFDASELFVRHFLEVRKVKAQPFWFDE